MKRIAPIVAVIALLITTMAGIGWSATAQPGGHDHHHGHGTETPAASPSSGSRHSAGTSTGAFYMTITNNGDAADRLVSIETDAAEDVEIHSGVMNGGLLQMAPQPDGVEIPAGGELVFEPAGNHVMLVGLTGSLVDGEEFTATLTFEQAGEVEVTVPILRDAPDEGELTAEPVEAGDLVIEGVWARQAPKLDGATPSASPESSVPYGCHPPGSGTQSAQQTTSPGSLCVRATPPS